MPATTSPPPGTPLVCEMRHQTVWTDRHGDADLTFLDGDYVSITVQTLRSPCEAVPWGSRDGWKVRIYNGANPARWRRVRLTVTAIRESR